MKNRLAIAVVAVGLGAAYVGVKYRVPWAIGVVLAALGIYGFIVGTRMIVTRRADVPTSSGASAHVEYHTGVGARLWGALFLMFGAVAIALGVMIGFLPQGDPRLAQRIASSPLLSGLAMNGAGLAVGLYGATRLLAPRATFRETKLNRFEQIFQGVLFTSLGLAIVLAGVVRIAAPGTLTALRDGLFDWVRNQLR